MQKLSGTKQAGFSVYIRFRLLYVLCTCFRIVTKREHVQAKSEEAAKMFIISELRSLEGGMFKSHLKDSGRSCTVQVHTSARTHTID